MTPEQLQAFVDRCASALRDKQEAFLAAENLASFRAFDLNRGKALLRFREGSLPDREYPVILLGTWLANRNSWLWAWAEDSLPAGTRRRAKGVQRLLDLTGLELWRQERLDCDEAMSWDLAAVAVEALEARGVYRIPGPGAHTFVAFP